MVKTFSLQEVSNGVVSIDLDTNITTVHMSLKEAFTYIGQDVKFYEDFENKKIEVSLTLNITVI